MDEHRRAVEADFTHYYRTSLDEAISEWPMRTLYGHVQFLPPDAALWRVQESKQENPNRLVTNDANKIASFLGKTGMEIGGG